MWFQILHTYLLSLRFVASQYDPSIFILTSHQQTIILLVYVDDIVITVSTNDILIIVIQALQQQICT
jgi:hypothetical protein